MIFYMEVCLHMYLYSYFPAHPGGPRGAGHDGKAELSARLRDQAERAGAHQHDQELRWTETVC